MTRFAQKPQILNAVERLQRTTPARIGVGRIGVRPTTDSWLRFRQDHAMAKDAVRSEFSPDFLQSLVKRGYPLVRTLAVDKADFISFPPKGKEISAATVAQLREVCPQHQDVQVVISDGLSARAVEANAQSMLEPLIAWLQEQGVTCGLPVAVQLGRVRVADRIAAALSAKIVVNLVGERPGLSTAESMSAYITYNPTPATLSADRTVISNIHRSGTAPDDAARQAVKLIRLMLTHQASGVRLQQLLSVQS